MDKEIKREALRQYFKYFSIWFIITGIVIIFTIGVVLAKSILDNRPKKNNAAPVERVFDYADVLTDEEEEHLRQEIARCEKSAQIDIVVVTIDQPMGVSDWEWEDAMMNYADDFYDEGKFGWNQAYGDGALLLDNWYEDVNGSQKGSWLSTSGKMEQIIGAWEEGQVFDAMYRYIDNDPFRAYCAAVKKLEDFGNHGANYVHEDVFSLCFLWVIPFIVAIIYAAVHMRQSKAKDTTVASTYVENGRPVVRSRSDEFIRKNVVSHRIESSSGGGGGGSHHSGGGSHGSHRSSGGHSHGGGGRRR